MSEQNPPKPQTDPASPQPHHSVRNRVVAVGTILAAGTGVGIAVNQALEQSASPPPSHTRTADSLDAGHSGHAGSEHKNKLTVGSNTYKLELPGAGDSQSAPHQEHTQTEPRKPRQNLTEVVPKEPGPKGRPKTPILKIPHKKLPKPPELLNLHPENKIPPEVSKILHENTAYIPSLGCSGFLIRDERDNPIGVFTAEHCSLLPDEGHWKTGDDGKPYLHFDAHLTVYTGDSADQLTPMGRITEFALNDPAKRDADQALGAFQGHSIEEVLARYRDMTVSASALDRLKRGDIVYGSGWPVDQKNNPGPLRRQEFSMSVFGFANWQVSAPSNEQLDLLVTGVVETADGAEASWGNSGSAAIEVVPSAAACADGTVAITVGEDGKPCIIGSASAFSDFGFLARKDPADAAAERDYVESHFGVDTAGFVGISGFGIKQPTPENGAVFLKVETPALPIESQYAEDFFTPSFIRHIINGYVQLPNGTFADRPAVYYDAASDKTLLAWYNEGANQDNPLKIESFTGDSISSLIVYRHDPQADPSLIDSTGSVAVSHDPGQPGFVDQNGLHFGYLSFGEPPGVPVDALEIQNGQIAFEPLSQTGPYFAKDTAIARAEFKDPAYDKNIPDGLFSFPTPKGNDLMWVRRPVVFYNPQDGSAVVGYSTDWNSGELNTIYYPSLDQVRLYSDQPDNSINMHHSKGNVTFQPDNSDQTYGQYIDSQGYDFGEVLKQGPLKPGAAYALAYVNGELVLQPAPPDNTPGPKG